MVVFSFAFSPPSRLFEIGSCSRSLRMKERAGREGGRGGVAKRQLFRVHARRGRDRVRYLGNFPLFSLSLFLSHSLSLSRRLLSVLVSVSRFRSVSRSASRRRSAKWADVFEFDRSRPKRQALRKCLTQKTAFVLFFFHVRRIESGAVTLQLHSRNKAVRACDKTFNIPATSSKYPNRNSLIDATFFWVVGLNGCFDSLDEP